MSEITNRDIEWLLNLHKNPDSAVRRKKLKLKRLILYLFLSLTAIAFLVILPFFLLIRVSLTLVTEFDFPAWIALTAGMGSAIFLLLGYIFVIFRKFLTRIHFIRFSFYSVTVMVLSFCVFSLFYLSGDHAKTPEIRNVYGTMHPVLRVAISTVTLADSDLLITDIERNPGDYLQMGLPLNSNSFHFKQPDGYVHAVDLRTIGHSFIRNAILDTSLQIMGFETIRHTGTADHLHVQIPDLPNK